MFDLNQLRAHVARIEPTSTASEIRKALLEVRSYPARTLSEKAIAGMLEQRLRTVVRERLNAPTRTHEELKK